ncbi:MAG TPA: HAD family phosphatase [Burkholderiales bacterium]|nr:HAD family phosphatase [Burkholderiales bacterium]
MNLIFDLGGVVVRWDPAAIIASVFQDQKLRAKAREGVFEHADWLELDRGTLGREDAIRRAAQRTGIDAAELTRLLIAVPPSLVPIPQTVELLYRLKAGGYPLYCLSNMHLASIEHLEREQKFFEVFTGRVISCRLNLCKPEPAIYRHALQTYGLRAEDTVFIDDVEVNIQAAAKVGLRTIQFRDAAQCERELRALGVSL